MITGRKKISILDILALKPPFSSAWLEGYSPSAIIAAYLISEGLGTRQSDDDDWPMFISSMPDIAKDCSAVYDTSPLIEGKLMRGGVVVEHYGIMVKVKSDDYETGWSQITRMMTVLDELLNVEIELSENLYLLKGCTRRSGPQFIGQDTETRKSLFTMNYTITINIET